MIQDAHISWNNFIVQNSSGRYVNSIAMVGNNYDSASQGNSPAKGNIARDCQMVQLNDVWYVGESSQKLLHLAEMIVAELDQGRSWEHSLRRHDQGATSQTVQVGHHQQKIRGLFDGQEARSWHIYSNSTVETLHCGTNSCLQLNYSQAVV